MTREDGPLLAQKAGGGEAKVKAQIRGALHFSAMGGGVGSTS